MEFIERTSGIYGIKERRDSWNYLYIGSTSDFNRRYNQHLSKLKKGCHENKGLQSFCNRSSVDALCFEIIRFCELDELIKFEREFIARYKPSFNIIFSDAPTDVLNFIGASDIDIKIALLVSDKYAGKNIVAWDVFDNLTEWGFKIRFRDFERIMKMCQYKLDTTGGGRRYFIGHGLSVLDSRVLRTRLEQPQTTDPERRT